MPSIFFYFIFVAGQNVCLTMCCTFWHLKLKLFAMFSILYGVRVRCLISILNSNANINARMNRNQLKIRGIDRSLKNEQEQNWNCIKRRSFAFRIHKHFRIIYSMNRARCPNSHVSVHWKRHLIANIAIFIYNICCCSLLENICSNNVALYSNALTFLALSFTIFVYIIIYGAVWSASVCNQFNFMCSANT